MQWKKGPFELEQNTGCTGKLQSRSQSKDRTGDYCHVGAGRKKSTYVDFHCCSGRGTKAERYCKTNY